MSWYGPYDFVRLDRECLPPAAIQNNFPGEMATEKGPAGSAPEYRGEASTSTLHKNRGE